MFRDEELEVLRLRKELLVCQCDARRLLLLSECRRLRSPRFWLDEAGRHPLWTAGLATAAGALTVQALRRPRMILGGVGRLGRFLPALIPVLRLFAARKRGT